MATIYFVGGEVGGAGKTMCCMLLIECFLQYQILYHFRDADRTTPNVGWAYDTVHYPRNAANTLKTSVSAGKKKKKGDDDGAPEVIDNWKPVFFSEDFDDFSQADKLIDLAQERDVIVNLPAQVSNSFDKWLEAGDFLDTQDELGVNFVYLWVAKAEQRSIDMLLANIQRFPKMPHILVCNQLRGVGEKWDAILTDELEKSLQAKGVKIISMPELQLTPDERGVLDRDSPRLQDLVVADDKRLGAASKARLKKFMRVTIENIVSTGYLAVSPAETAAPETAPENQPVT